MRRFPLLALALSLAACSTSNKVVESQIKDHNDDVYFADTQAKEEVIYARSEKKESEKNYRTDEQLYGGNDLGDYDYYNFNEYYYDRFNRDMSWLGYNRYYNFNFSPWYNYYSFNGYGYNLSPWYNYYGYNSWYGPGVSIYFGYSPWRYNGYLYGYPYSSRYWGPISYNNYFPGYGYGGYAGVYYPASGRDQNYRPRPNRGSENISGFTPGIGTVRKDGQGRIMNSPSRGGIYERNNPTSPTGRTTSGTGNTGSTVQRTRPDRVQSVERPSSPRIQQENPRQYQPEARQPEPRQPAPSSSGSSGGGDSDSRARPSRAGN